MLIDQDLNFEQKGYDAWVELWAQHGCSPRASECPARYMPDGRNRYDYIRGWNRARRDNEE